MPPKELIRAARAALENAHAPYSGFRVGAALQAENGRVYRGANVENASLGLSVCAERAAVFAAVADGARRFTALAIATDTPEPSRPCGACRQILREFVADLPVYLVGRGDAVLETSLAALLPDAFSPDSLGKGADNSGANE